MPKKEQMAISDFNMLRLTTEELSQHISSTIQIGGNIAVFGRRGTGKTEIAKHEIASLNYKEVYLNLSVFERVDLGGYPNIIATKERFVDFLLPRFYEPLLEGDINVVTLLDEIDKADPSIWAPLLEFTQFRSINGCKLPNLRAVIMTGNLISEGGQRPSLPLLDRSEKYIVEADATSWLKWAGKTGGIHPSITAFISDNPDNLFEVAEVEDKYATTSPRGWHRASDILCKGEEYGWDSQLLHNKVCGCVGKDAGIKYFNYYEHYQELLPIVDDVFKGADIRSKYSVLEPTKKLVACMIVCARFASILDKANRSDNIPAIKYVARFLHNVHPEVVLASIRSQIQRTRVVKFALDDVPEWDKLLKEIYIKNDC